MLLCGNNILNILEGTVCIILRVLLCFNKKQYKLDILSLLNIHPVIAIQTNINTEKSLTRIITINKIAFPRDYNNKLIIFST